jgi:hypothetical protein
MACTVFAATRLAERLGAVAPVGEVIGFTSRTSRFSPNRIAITGALKLPNSYRILQIGRSWGMNRTKLKYVGMQPSGITTIKRVFAADLLQVQHRSVRRHAIVVG